MHGLTYAHHSGHRLYHGHYTSAGRRKILGCRYSNCHDHSVFPAEVLLANLAPGMNISLAGLVTRQLIKLLDTSNPDRGKSAIVQSLH